MPKPVLSDSLFNANDVASAILDSAELSVTNQDFGVSDQRSILQIQTGWINTSSSVPPILYTFNGFAFISFSLIHSSGTPTSPEVCMQITNSNFYPIEKMLLPTVSKDGDTGRFVVIKTDGDITIDNPDNSGESNFYICVNGWYRYT